MNGKSDYTNGESADLRDGQAADYVLGLLDQDTREDVAEALKHDAELRQRVAFWQNRLQDLADRVEPIKPSTETFAVIEAAIAGNPPPGSITIRADDGEWEELFAGVFKKALLVDKAEGAESYLLRIDPGAVCPAHSHTKTEECLVLEGEMIIGTARFAAGDYHAAPPKIPHLPITSETGTVLYVRSELHG